MPRQPFIAWQHFSRIEGRPDSAKCNVCGNIYNRGGGTKNLLDHLQRMHRELLQPDAVAPNAGNNFYDDDDQRDKELNKWLLRLFAKDYQPFRMVEDDGFVKMVRALDPRYKLPSRQTISKKLIPDLYEEVKAKVRQDINASTNVALTTDGWTSKSQHSFLAVTAHYIRNGNHNGTSSPTLKSACLDCSTLTGNHSAENIAERLNAVIRDWHLQGKVCAVVTDNAINMVNAVKSLKVRHLGCSAHTLNLVVNDAIGADTVHDIKGLLDRCSAIVTFFKRSNLAIDKLRSLRVAAQKTPLGLVQQVSTRWNSTLAMIRRLQDVRPELAICLSELPDGPIALSGQDWNILKEMEEILRPIEDMTNAPSGEKYVTASLIIPYSHGLLKKAGRDQRQRNFKRKLFLAEVVKAAKTRLLNYEQRTVSRNATYMNPRFKKVAFVSSNRAEEARKAIEEEVQGVLQKVHDPRGAASQDGVENEPAYNGLLSFLNEVVGETSSSSTCGAEATILIRQYNEMPPINADPIEYWYGADAAQKALAYVAGYYLCVPATSVPAERLFSKAGYIITERRNALAPAKATMFIFLHANESFY